MKQIQKLSNKVIPIAKAKKTKGHFPVNGIQPLCQVLSNLHELHSKIEIKDLD